MSRKPEIQYHQPWKVQKFLDCVASGQPLTAAAALADISPRIVYYWLDKGKDEENDQNRVYCTFAEKFARARELSLAGYIAEIRKLGCEGERKDWRAAAWLSERIHREQLWLNHTAPAPGSVVNHIYIATRAADLPRASSVKTREIEASPVSGSESGEAT